MPPTPNDPPDTAALEAERAALRVQAAAVAAQQAALTLEEERLRQRAAALERQEAQLAEHLDQRRQRLAELQAQVRNDQQALKSEQAANRERQAAREAEVEQLRVEAMAGGDAARKERKRLIELRKRLRLRWRQRLHSQEKELAAGWQQLAADSTSLQRERTVLVQAQMRFNGEAELGRRQLQEGWQELSLAQQDWDACLNHEHAERERKAAELDACAAALAVAEEVLVTRQCHWEQGHAALQREVEVLENRIRSKRQRLLEAPVYGTQTPVTAAPLAPIPALPAPAVLGRLAGDLADQRLHLVEQWQRLLAVCNGWRADQSAITDELEAAVRQLAESEQRLAAREHDLQAEAMAWRQRQESAAQLRFALEGRQARLAAREAAWDSERAALLATVRAREEATEKERQRLEGIRQRWEASRRADVEEALAMRARCEDVRKQYLLVLAECQTRQVALAREQREVAAQALALERLRLELVGRSTNAVAAERRITKLTRRGLARVAADQRELAWGQETLARETARLGSEWERLRDEDRKLAARREALARLQEEWQAAQEAKRGEEEGRQMDLRQLRALHERDARELAALRDEMERVARLLIEDGAAVHPEVASQAA